MLASSVVSLWHWNKTIYNNRDYVKLEKKTIKKYYIQKRHFKSELITCLPVGVFKRYYFSLLS